MKIGRNEPCPCGSGKKFKRCCMLVDNPASVVSDDLKDFLGNVEANSLEEVQAMAEQFMQQKNDAAQDDFLGLTPEQMHLVLHFPCEPSSWFTLPKVLSVKPQAPILVLVQGIANAIDEKGLKATATGKLPAKLCKALFEEYKAGKAGCTSSSFLKVSKEDDFYDLHVVRLILELSGLLRKTKGRFMLTKKYQKVMATTGTEGLYPILFETFCTKFNWAYADGYDDISLQRKVSCY